LKNKDLNKTLNHGLSIEKEESLKPWDESSLLVTY